MDLVGLALALRVKGVRTTRKGVHEALGPIGLRFTRAVFREVGVVFEQLGFNSLQGRLQVLFFLVV